MRRQLLAAVLMIVSMPSMAASAACYGQFPNLFTDICWDCSFPIRLFGGVTMSSGTQEDYDPGGIPNLCVCNDTLGVPKSGFHTSFWEFARQAEVTRTPYCMVSLGIELNVDINPEMRGADSFSNTERGVPTRMMFRHAHWYINPAMGLMEVALDSKCLEPKGFDVAYMSEIDPTHSDEEMERILNPESYLFGNIVAQLACAADCVAATAGWGINTLYWCGGCQGAVIPMVGYMSSTYGGVQASSLMVHRVTAKLHRMLTQTTTAGNDAMCGTGGKFQINMDKRQYKYSMIFPSSQSSVDNSTYPTSGQASNLAGMPGSGADPAAASAYAGQAQQAQSSQFMRCCQPYGRTTAIWGAGRETPRTGEDFAYAIFRKRDCCQ